MTCPSWVPLHSIVHSFPELLKPLRHDKAAIRAKHCQVRLFFSCPMLNLASSRNNPVAPSSPIVHTSQSTEVTVQYCTRYHFVLSVSTTHYPSISHWHFSNAASNKSQLTTFSLKLKVATVFGHYSDIFPKKILWKLVQNAYGTLARSLT